MELEDAKSKIKLAGVLGLVVAAWTAFVVLATLRGYGSELLQYFADPWMFLDVLLVAGLSIGVLRKNRLAACLLFAYFGLSKILIALETGKPGSLIVTVLLLTIFGRGVQAAFVYHRLNPSPAPAPGGSKLRTFGFFAGSVAVLGFFSLMALGLAMELGFLPDTAVVSGSELRPSTVELLRSHRVLGEDESIRYFYSEGLLSVLEGGNFFTNSRVVSYADLTGDAYFDSAPFEEVADIEIQYSESWLDDSVVTVYTDKGDSFFLIVSSEEKKDRVFFEALIETWRKNRPEQG